MLEKMRSKENTSPLVVGVKHLQPFGNCCTKEYSWVIGMRSVNGLETLPQMRVGNSHGRKLSLLQPQRTEIY